MQFHVNSWTFERWMGALPYLEWDGAAAQYVEQVETHPQLLTLPELLVKLGAEGYSGVELAYVHLRERDSSALANLRQVALRAGVELTSLLLDFGDPSSANPIRQTADSQQYRAWIDCAAEAGFRQVRIGAGEAAPDDQHALARATEVLTALSGYAEVAGIRLVTENLGSLLTDAENCKQLLRDAGGKVGLTVDFGNFQEEKYRQLQEILPMAETIHAKVREDEDGQIDAMDFLRCTELARQAAFKGPFSLTYLGKGEPWAKLDELRDLSNRESV